MSRTHLLAASTTVLLAGAIGVSAALHAFPLTPTEQAAQTEAGPLEKQAYVAPRDAPPPVRVHYVAPQVPASAKGIDEVTIDVRLVIDAQGRVAEARGVKGTAAFANPAGVEALGAAVVAAARQWRFEAPAMAPLAVTTTLTFRPDGAAAAKFTSTERPLVVDMKAAVYPEDARTAKVEGDVQAEVTLGPDGGVTDVRVVKTPMPSMGEAAVTALKASTFRPGMKDGVPVPVMITITVRFKLQ